MAEEVGVRAEALVTVETDNCCGTVNLQVLGGVAVNVIAER